MAKRRDSEARQMISLGGTFSLMILFFQLLVSGSAALGGVSPPKRILIGNSFELKLPGVSRIRLSREGVVYVRPSAGDLWRFTGVGKGVVVMHPQRNEENEGRKQLDPDEIVVEVQTKPTRSSKMLRRAARTKSEAKRDCESLIPFYEAFEFVVTMRSTRKGESNGMKSRFGVELNGTTSLRSSLGGGSSGLVAAKALASLADDSAESKTKVLSRPRMVLAPGRKTTLKSGGEFKVDAPVFDSRAPHTANEVGFITTKFGSWKEFGLVVSATWLDCANDQARVEYDVSLLQRTSAGSETLASGRVTGSRVVPHKKWVFGGAIDFATGSAMKAGSSIFSSVPIIGPFMVRRDQESGDSEMVVWLRGISELQPEVPELDLPIERDFGDGTAITRK